MITVRWALGAIVAATAVSASADELQLFARLLKRQEPGTPAYNCHDNCGKWLISDRTVVIKKALTNFLNARPGHYPGAKQCRCLQRRDIFV